MFLALLAAGCWGTSAFMAALSTRRMPALAVVFYSQAVGVALLAAWVLLWPAAPAPADVAWGAAAGAGTVIALGALYQGLAVGRMSVVSPLAALIAVSTPATLDVVRGTLPSPAVIAGLAVAMVAIVLLSTGVSTSGAARAGGPSGVGHAVVAGFGFAVFLIALDQASATAGAWPLVGTRIVSAGLLGAVLFAAGNAAPAAARAQWKPLLVIGLIEVTGVGLYFTATALTTLTTAVVLSSLHPVVTVLWARALLRERLGPRRIAGVAASLGAIALIVSG